MKTDRIAHLYDDPGPFATAVVDVSRDTEDGAKIAELQVRAVRDGLSEAGAPDKVVDEVAERVEENTRRPAPVSRVVVATQAGVLFDEFLASPVGQPTITWDCLPDLGPWLSGMDGALPFVLAIADHEGGTVATYRSNAPTPDTETDVEGQTMYAHKVPTGGWSALRYQHSTENVWAANARAVSDEIEKHIARGFRVVLLGGDVRQRAEVARHIEGSPDVEVIELSSGSHGQDGGEDALREAVVDAIGGLTLQRRMDEVRELRDRLGQGGRAVTGARDTVDAFVRGQVDTLLLDPPSAAALTVRPADHEGLAVGAVSGLPADVRADLLLVALAALTAAEVAVLPQSTMFGSPVAALLRWEQPST